jgi:hypothetical protein
MDGPVLPQTAAPVEQPRQRTALVDSRWFPLLIAAMVACGTLYAVAGPRSDSFLTRDASIPVLLADVDRGAVHGVYQDGDDVVWRPDGALTWSSARMVGYARANKPINGLQDVLTEAAAVNSDVTLEIRTPGRPWRWLSIVGAVGSLFAFLLLVAGPDPRRANRWGWFWILGFGRDYGIGVLAFLLLGAQRRPREGDLGRRADGLKCFVLAFVASIVVGIPFSLLHDQVVADRDGRAEYTYDVPA